MSACSSAQLSDINHIHVCMIITSLPVSATLIPDWITFLPLPTVVSCVPHGPVQSTQFIEAESLALCVWLISLSDPRGSSTLWDQRELSLREAEWQSRHAHAHPIFFVHAVVIQRNSGGCLLSDVVKMVLCTMTSLTSFLEYSSGKKILHHKAISLWKLANLFP